MFLQVRFLWVYENTKYTYRKRVLTMNLEDLAMCTFWDIDFQFLMWGKYKSSNDIIVKRTTVCFT